MINLFVSTATSRIVVAIIKDNKMLFNYNELEKDSLSEKVMPIIEKAFNETELEFNQIDKIYVVNGPGSFTGIRIGVTFAKTLAWALKKPIMTISMLELLATTKVDTEVVMPLIDARRGYVFGSIYDSDLKCIVKDQHILLDDLISMCKCSFTKVSDDSIGDILPDIDIIKVINKYKDQDINPHMVNPNYLKLTEAEEKLNERNN